MQRKNMILKFLKIRLEDADDLITLGEQYKRNNILS